MAKANERYSDKRLNDSFLIEVLLREPLQFHAAEVLGAAAEDYPGLDWSADFSMSLPVDTANVSICAVSPTVKETFGQIIFQSMPQTTKRDWSDALKKSALFYPGNRDAVARHRSVLTISVDSVGTSLAARFDAARRLTCLGAIIAKLPIAEAVAFPSADLIIPPKQWIEAAEQAMLAKVPWPQWIHVSVNPMPDGTTPVPVTVDTIGMAAFNGHEIRLPLARLSPAEAAKHVVGALTLFLEFGNTFSDGDTIGGEDDPIKLRLRHVAEGDHGMQTDTWVLLHPATTLDEQRDFGPQPGQPPPPGIDNTDRGDADALKKKLYSFFAGGKERSDTPPQ